MNESLMGISRQFAGRPRNHRRPARPRPSRRADNIRADARVWFLDREPDGWFITLRPGWRLANDPCCPTHCIGEDNLREIWKHVETAQPCSCDQCQREKGAAHA